MPDGNDGRDRPKPFQTVTAWVIGLAALIGGVTLLASNSEALWKIFGARGASDGPVITPSATPSAPMSAIPTASPPPTAGPTSGNSSPTPSAAVFSSGDNTIRGTWSFDLDNGVTAVGAATADLWWDQIDNTQRRLQPKNGAQFSLVGARDFASLTNNDLKNLTYSADDIRGDNDISNAIPTGTVLAFKTKSGRYGKMLIVNYGYDLRIKWVTFAP